jgi:glycosyltransferase involved in cell wall biosynthesis
VLFLGNYAHPPNRSAADRLTALWPSVRERAPEARLVLAGPRPELLSSYGVRPDGVEFPGFIDDLANLYRSTALVCAPIGEGGGTRVKLLEAGAWGCPIVATRIAAEGIGFEDGVHYLMREEDDAIADACADLLHDPARGRALGRAARELVSDRYSKRAVTEQVRRLFASHGLPEASNASGAA